MQSEYARILKQRNLVHVQPELEEYLDGGNLTALRNQDPTASSLQERTETTTKPEISLPSQRGPNLKARKSGGRHHPGSPEKDCSKIAQFSQSPA